MTADKNERQFHAEGNDGARRQSFHRRPHRRRRPNHQGQQGAAQTGSATSVANQVAVDPNNLQAGRSTRQSGHLPPRTHNTAKEFNTESEKGNEFKTHTPPAFKDRTEHMDKVEQQRSHPDSQKQRNRKSNFKAEESLEDIRREATRIEKEIFLEISTIAAIGLD